MKRLFLIAALVLIPWQALAVELDADSNGYQDLDKGGTNAATEQDPTVDTSAEIQAIIGAGVYEPSLDNPATTGFVLSSTDAGVRSWVAVPTAASLAVDDLITLSGVAEGAVNLGAFTGSTITDNQTVKAAIQALETFAETLGGGVDFTAYDGVTWGTAAGGSQVHTFDTGAGTDPTMTVSDTDFTFNKPVIASSFSAPGTASGGQYIYFLEDTDNGTNYLGWGIYGDVSASRIHIPPLADPTAGQVMAFAVPGNQTMGDGTTKIASVGTWITPLLNVVEDTTPQLGGNLDLNTNEITVKDADWLPIEWAEDGSTAPAAAAAITGTTRKVGRAFDGAANEDVTFIWRVPTDFTGTTVTARVTGVVSGATAPANTEVVAFSVALACYANSEASTLAVGTAQTTSLTADATYAQYDNLDTAYSSAITPAGSIAAGEECAAAVIRLATTTDTYAQDFTVTGVEFKYSRALSND